MHAQVGDQGTLPDEAGSLHLDYSYPTMRKKLGNFQLTVEAGRFTNSQIIVMLGENGTGKTTFIRMLAGGMLAGPSQSGGQWSGVPLQR